MKIQFISNFTEKAKKHKKISFFAGILVVAGLCCAGYFGWQQYLYRQSSQYALEKIKAALNPPDAAEIAELVDIKAVSQNLAQAIKKSFPFYLQGPDQERNISHALQTALLRKFLNKEEKKQQTLVKEDEETLLRKNLEFLPSDFFEQLIANAHILQSGNDIATVAANVKNPALSQPFTFVFDMSRTSSGWKVTRLANASEVVSHAREAMLARYARLRTIYQEKNAAASKIMNQTLPVQSCMVDAGMLSDNKTFMLVVHIIARNKGNTQINNFNLNTSILGKNNKVLLRRYLNAAKPVLPGEDFDHRWTIELDGASPEARALAHGGPLQCRAVWQTLSLNNGQVVHMYEEPHSARECPIAGHHHPEGFCMLPEFKN